MNIDSLSIQDFVIIGTLIFHIIKTHIESKNNTQDIEVLKSYLEQFIVMKSSLGTYNNLVDDIHKIKEDIVALKIYFKIKDNNG